MPDPRRGAIRYDHIGAVPVAIAASAQLGTLIVRKTLDSLAHEVERRLTEIGMRERAGPGRQIAASTRLLAR
jgi:hypothetical protein